ncbi:uncharacterized protein LOC113297676 [Papaver somniferum]|uniref:uncharacterized protein LOC113297676 n=1 Tax=Papaver somniferum TaxID=3469 RepID=UPI000E6FFAFC|nr:uncharacterized protein LOC113297676 [Papaver somniferum]
MVEESLTPVSSPLASLTLSQSLVSNIILLSSIADLTTLTFISSILLLSFFSIFFILHFRLKSHQSQHLKDFNSLYTVRILFVSFISFWAINDILRLPYLIPPYFLSFLYKFPSLSQQVNLCKAHIVLSQGFFQPGFFIILLFLVNISAKKKIKKNIFCRAILVLFAVCIPLLALQIFFIFFSTRLINYPEILFRGFQLNGVDGKVICTYPLMSTIVFAIFGIIYMILFTSACWKVCSIVINKGLRVRIYLLVITVLFSVSAQILILTASALWKSHELPFDWLGFVVFLSGLLCAVVGEGILVIKPIADALAVDSQFYRCDNDYRL